MSKRTVTQAQIHELIEGAEIEVTTTFDKCTVVSAKLPNGFVLVESSACVDPANYDPDVGRDICMKRITDKLWELEGYALQKLLAGISAPPEKWSGEKLKAARKAAGLTQKQVADAAGYVQVNVAQWEKDKEPRPTALKKLAYVIGCSMDDLV